MKRIPYQPAQTSMERHVQHLVDHLQNGTDTRSGFAKSVEQALAHAFWLENAYIEAQVEIRKLEMAMMPRLPSFTASSKQIDTRDPQCQMPGGSLYFEWGMEQIAWRGLRNGFDPKDEDIARRVRRRTFKELARIFRREFERTWTLNMGRVTDQSR